MLHEKGSILCVSDAYDLMFKKGLSKILDTDENELFFLHSLGWKLLGWKDSLVLIVNLPDDAKNSCWDSVLVSKQTCVSTSLTQIPQLDANEI